MVADENKAARVKAALQRSKKLIQMGESIDKIAKAHKNDINASLDPSNNVTSDSMVTTKRNRNVMSPSAIGAQMTGAGAMNVPSAIRESFSKNPIDDSPLYSVLGNDGLDVSFLTETQQPVPQVTAEQIRQLVGEGTQQQQPQMVMQSQGIDYPMIRTIVEETMRKYTASLKKSLLTESKQLAPNELNTLVMGKTFKFLDSKGNLYECTMKKISNINEIKKAKK